MVSFLERLVTSGPESCLGFVMFTFKIEVCVVMKEIKEN